MKEYGPWKITASREVYRDPWLTVQLDNVIRPDGKEGTYSVAKVLPGVCVVARGADGTLYLTEEFHYAVGRRTLEGVSGGRDEGETPLEAARRELREELGISAERWTDLGTVDPLTGSLLSPTQLFLAETLQFQDAQPEGTELIRCVEMTLSSAVEAVLRSQITHGPTCVLLLKIARLSPDPAA